MMTLGDVLAAAGRKDDARAAYDRAMHVVKSMEPEAQEALGPEMQKKIDGGAVGASGS
jgi:predicted negative regulator of RcsB-dependent stress response